MASLDDLNSRLEALKLEVLKQGPLIAQELAVNALALAKHRIQTEGVRGKQYSTREIWATETMFNRKSSFKPTEIERTELGRTGDGRLMRGGFRNPRTGKVEKKETTRKKRWLWIKFKKAKKAVPIMILPGGYKQLRALNGLQTSFVDLTFSGRLFQNIKLLEPRNQGTKFLAVIGASNLENKAKMAGLAIRYGRFLDPEKDELEILSTIQRDRISKLIKQRLG